MRVITGVWSDETDACARKANAWSNCLSDLKRYKICAPIMGQWVIRVTKKNISFFGKRTVTFN